MNEETKTVNLVFDINAVNIILAGLGKLPLESSIQLFNEIHKQVGAQMEQAPDGPLKDKVVK